MNRRGLLCGLVAAPIAPLAALLPKPKPVHDGNLITWEGIKSKVGDPLNALAEEIDKNTVSIQAIDGMPLIRKEAVLNGERWRGLALWQRESDCRHTLAVIPHKKKWLDELPS